MSRTFAVSLSVALVVTACSFAEACRCLPPPAPKKALEKSSAVFSGKVTKIEKNGLNLKVTFAVEQSWKGPAEKELVVTTNASSAACGYSFTKGRSYLVFCSGGKNLKTGLCSRTRGLGAAKRDLEELGEGEKPKDD